jgi:dUTP pyrophosphatase
VKVLLFNFGDDEFVVNVNDRIAQMIIERIAETELKKIDQHSSSKRGEGGFGSTGVN